MPAKLPLPRGWKRRVRSSVLHILAVGQHAATCSIRRRRDLRLLGMAPGPAGLVKDEWFPGAYRWGCRLRVPVANQGVPQSLPNW